MSEETKITQTVEYTTDYWAQEMNYAMGSQDYPKIFYCASRLAEPLKKSCSAKEYYEHFLQIFEKLLMLSGFLSRRELKPEQYDQAQFAVDIVPRLYVMITVGISLYRQMENDYVLEDMLDMVRGVQHPVRGLFLRYYLNKKVKDLYKENSQISINFILNNLSQMNSLWSRIEFIDERKALQITVGENIERLSEVCTDLELYLGEVFPKCLSIIKLSDPFSQKFLLDCIVQAFPTEFFLHTCVEFLNIACNIQLNYDVIDLVSSSLSKLQEFLKDLQKSASEDSLSNMKKFLESVRNSKTPENLEKIIELHMVVLKFSTKTPQSLENMLYCLESADLLLDTEHKSIIVFEYLTEILQIATIISIEMSVTSSNFHNIYSELQSTDKERVSYKIIEIITNEEYWTTNVEFWTSAFDYLQIIAYNNSFLKQKLMVLKILHRRELRNFEVYQVAAKKFKDDECVLTGVCFLCLQELKSEHKMHKIIAEALEMFSNSYFAIQMIINTILAFNSANIDYSITELFEKIVRSYETLVDNSQKLSSLTMIIGCARQISNSYLPTDKIVNFCYKLPKKTDQCCLLLSLSHVFWSNILKDPTKLLEILKRSVKLADLCVAGTKNLWFFVLILNTYLYYFQCNVSSIEVNSVNSLIELIYELISYQGEDDQDLAYTKKYFYNTIKQIQLKQEQGVMLELRADYKINI